MIDMATIYLKICKAEPLFQGNLGRTITQQWGKACECEWYDCFATSWHRYTRNNNGNEKPKGDTAVYAILSPNYTTLEGFLGIQQ